MPIGPLAFPLIAVMQLSGTMVHGEHMSFSRVRSPAAIRECAPMSGRLLAHIHLERGRAMDKRAGGLTPRRERGPRRRRRLRPGAFNPYGWVVGGVEASTSRENAECLQGCFPPRSSRQCAHCGTSGIFGIPPSRPQERANGRTRDALHTPEKDVDEEPREIGTQYQK